ncbi:collagen alpha-1(X) chain-like isoform X2 [Vidua chalybeata]|uniref:collagen alpha-1(X) chain-like isoform X2 n=1 Tax=Vidua chalybeata TaxID=81927 RepID=UPI0023A7B9AA|nr:collagen alpha-1(X) chain-like isoform X2 [Vidua chalybeata]
MKAEITETSNHLNFIIWQLARYHPLSAALQGKCRLHRESPAPQRSPLFRGSPGLQGRSQLLRGNPGSTGGARLLRGDPGSSGGIPVPQRRSCLLRRDPGSAEEIPAPRRRSRLLRRDPGSAEEIPAPRRKSRLLRRDPGSPAPPFPMAVGRRSLSSTAPAPQTGRPRSRRRVARGAYLVSP